MAGKWVNGDGPVPCRIMFVGEAPGKDEVKQGRPFCGKTGVEFNNLLMKVMRLRRDECYVTNMVRFQLEENKEVSDEDWDVLSATLRNEIRDVDPVVIVSMGAMATRYFMGDRQPKRKTSTWWDMEMVNGVPHHYDDTGCIVVPCFHPAACFRDAGRYIWVEDALRVAYRILNSDGMAAPPFLPPDTIIDEGLHLATVTAVDTETRVDGSPYIIGTCGEVGKAALVRVDDDRGWLEILRAHLEDPATTTVMHNAMFDVRVLERVNIHPHHWIDTMQVAFLIQGLPLGLKELAYRLLRVRMTTYKEAVGGSADLSSVPWTTAMTYAGADPDMTLRILNTLTSIMYEGMSNVLTRDMAVQPMVMAMMERGIRLDKPYVMGMEAELELRNMDLLEQIREWGGPEFNPASGDQVAWLLYDILGVNDGVRLKRTKKGRYSTDAKAVKQLKGKHELVKLIAEWKETDTLIDKYIAVLPKKVRGDGRIHANLSMVRVPHSGRLAATNPNLLAQPIRSDDGKRIRNAYVAEEGYSFVSCDYDQQEMRIMAHLSGDPTMLSAYREGKDVHTETAMRVFHISDPKKVDKEKHRRPAKAVSFGIIYGISPRGLSEQLGDWSEQQCERLLEEWFIVYPGVREYMEKVAAHVRRYWHITDMWGRRTRFPDVRSVYEPTVTAAIRKAVNQTIQGSAQGQTKQAMVELWPLVKEWMAEGLVFPILQVHDDLLWEVRDDAVREVVPYIKVVMENVAALDVPVIVETKVGKRWGELVPV